MELRVQKPKLSARALVELLRDEKGVSFLIMNEEAAIEYLSQRNNYLRTASYRKNYQKYTQTDNAGKYINLEFAYLAELSYIDHCLRTILLKMCIDVEHALKVQLVDRISIMSNEDGYKIVDEYFQKHPSVLTNIANKADAVFTKDLINKYFELCDVFDNDSIKVEIIHSNCPVWVLMEIIGFGELTRFLDHCTSRDIVLDNNLSLKILNPVRSLRNACAHNNCLLNSLSASNFTSPPEVISNFVASIKDVPQSGRKKKLSCRPMFEIVCLLYTYKKLISPNASKKGILELKEFVNGRMIEHIEYFKKNLLVLTTLEFLQKIVDNLE